MCLGLFALQDNIPSLLKDESRESSAAISSLSCLDRPPILLWFLYSFVPTPGFFLLPNVLEEARNQIDAMKNRL